MSVLRVISNLFRFNRTNWKAVALCFFTALIFWLFTSLNKDHTTNISFPLQFEFDTDRYVSVVMPQHVNINVSGNGWDLLRKSFGLRLPVLSIPLDKPADVKKIPVSALLPLVAGQLGSLKPNYVVGDTLDVQIDLKDSHKFRLVAELSDVSFKKGYGRISHVVILPDSVEIEGPKSILHNLPDSIVLSLSRSKLSEHFKEELEVIIPNGEMIKRNPPVVEVRFEVGEVEELVGKLKLIYLNRPGSLIIENGQDSVTCRLIVPKTQGSTILAKDHGRAIVDLSGLAKGESTVAPRVEGLSAFVQILQVDSVHVKLF
jgi:YbbR domain-containing protein